MDWCTLRLEKGFLQVTPKEDPRKFKSMNPMKLVTLSPIVRNANDWFEKSSHKSLLPCTRENRLQYFTRNLSPLLRPSNTKNVSQINFGNIVEGETKKSWRNKTTTMADPRRALRPIQQATSHRVKLLWILFLRINFISCSSLIGRQHRNRCHDLPLICKTNQRHQQWTPRRCALTAAAVLTMGQTYRERTYFTFLMKLIVYWRMICSRRVTTMASGRTNKNEASSRKLK